MAVTMNAVELYTYDDTLRNDERYQGYNAINATYNMYTVEGIKDGDGNLRQLSISELVMAVCLARAQEKEAAVIELMKTMSDNTAVLEGLTDIETKLLAGTSLGSITDYYYYQGIKYSAQDFLAIVVGGATPNVANAGNAEMVTLGNQLADTNTHIIDVTGTYSIGSNSYTKAWEYLYVLGISTLTTYEANNFNSICAMVESLPDGYVFSDSELINISGYSPVNSIWLGMTKEDMVDQIDETYRESLVHFCQLQGLGSVDQIGSIENASSYLPSDTDELITQIESKMDSLNSFSQEKMIELQSETNKRDQAYDIITNVLKSLNNVLTSNANNI